MLHEMLTGRSPFKGGTGIDTMHAILHDPAPPLPPLGGTATDDLQRVLDKCLAKDPDERYQGMRDVVVDLKAARRRLDSQLSSAASARDLRPTKALSESAHRRPTWPYVAAAAVVVALVGVAALRSGSTTSRIAVPSGAGDKPSIAVLYFENNTGNAQLDWLRTGLADMLVTDLSQSPDVEVLPTDRLVQILSDLKRQDDRTISFDTVQEIAKRAGVKTVALGSYVKAGDTIRINLKLQDPFSGRLVTSERVDAAGESNLLPTVDDLTKRIKAKFLPASADPTKSLITSPIVVSTATGNAVDRDLKDVTTSSIDAYRYYAEGIDLHERFREREAIPLLDKAIEIDPNFAMALLKLAVAHGNLQHVAQARAYAARAFQHVDRLTARERYYVEGYYYGLNSATFDKAIQAYSKAIELFPDHASARHNLALLDMQLERYDDAIKNFEELRRRGMTFPATYGALAGSYASLGRFDQAYQIDREYVDRNGGSATGYQQLGAILTRGGRLDEALAAVTKAEALDPADPQALVERRNIYLLRENWGEVEAINRRLEKNDDATARTGALQSEAAIELLNGHAANALKTYETIARDTATRGNPAAAVRSNIASVLLDRGETAAALSYAEQAYDAVGDTGPQQTISQVLLGVAQARLGRTADAAKTVDRLRQQAQMPAAPPALKRALHLLNGRIALDRHDTAGALQELRAAEALLPPVPSPQPAMLGVATWFWLGSAYLAAHNDAEAAARFQRIVDGGVLRVPTPMEYVQSLYFLGQIHERKGDRAKAGEYYRKFVEYWGDGDIDRNRVADARSKITS
jgi:tetratricopeptide (TPR) repeat protein